MRSSVQPAAWLIEDAEVAGTSSQSKLVSEVMPGLVIDLPLFLEHVGLDSGEIFFHAGLMVIERAIVTARQSPWWSGLPSRIRKTVEQECDRGVRMIEFAERLQEAERQHMHDLTHGRLDDELRERAARLAHERKTA